MSRRSYDSFAHESRLSKYRVTDDDLFDYVLRLLSYLMTPKPAAPDVREHSSRLSALSNFSIGDMFRDVRDGSKSVKFPRSYSRFWNKSCRISRWGRMLPVRRTMGKFYGQFMVDSFKRQMKENRKIEELILMFATHSTSVLKKEPSLAGEGWKLELNNQIAQFIKLLRESLKSVNHVSPELLSRLDTYTAKLAPTLSQSQGYAQSDSGYDSAFGPAISANIGDMHLVKVVGNLFKFQTRRFRRSGQNMFEKYQCGAPFPGRREDFDSDAAWQHWRTLETPTSSNSCSRRSFLGDTADDAAEVDEDLPVGHYFTFIPPNPKKFYKRLVEYCLIADLEVMLSPEVDDNDELINECALRWRIGHSYLLRRNDVPLECIPEALQNVTKVIHETELELWPVHDVDYLANVYAGLFNVFLSSLYHSMDALPNLKQMQDVQDRIRQVSADWYDVIIHEKQSAPGVNRALPLLLMTDEIERERKALIRGSWTLSRYSSRLSSRLITELRNSQKRLFESSMNGPTPDVPIQDIFALYRRTTYYGVFEPYVRQWLVNTDDKTKQWVEAAISHDKFEAEGTEGHSSSIVDLFDSLRSPINFLQELEWEDEYQEGRFFTSLAKTISKAIDQYCRSIESLFLNEMFPRPSDYLQPQKSSAWLEKARQLAITGEKRVEPFNFRPESCVMLNNVEAARKLLDNMYNQMQADKIAEVVRNAAPPIVIAEGLVPLDSSPSSKLDTFTIYENLNPRWDETFDLSVDKPLWLMVSVRDRALVGKHDIVGRAYLCLDPRRFSDFLAHELWMDLDTQGRILVRELKRAEADMLRIFIDKMSPFIQQCLSRNVVKTLINLGTRKPRIRPEELTDVEIEQAILPLFDYFDANLQTLNTYLSDTAKEMVMTRVWKEILTIIEGLLIPPLSDIASEMKPLSDKEVDIVFRWLKFLRDYFYANGEGPVSQEVLNSQKHRDVLSIRLYYDWHTDALMEECVRMMQQSLRAAPSIKKRAKSVYSQRNLGTIKERKKEKKQETESASEQIIMRILRMRPRTQEFIAQQLQIMAAMQAEQEQHAREAEERKLKRQQNQQLREQVPPDGPVFVFLTFPFL
ncbi:homology domain-containing protein [Flammula alnicola]|nr:homology domain-containing protein [Flammula alnicola]